MSVDEKSEGLFVTSVGGSGDVVLWAQIYIMHT